LRVCASAMRGKSLVPKILPASQKTAGLGKGGRGPVKRGLYIELRFPYGKKKMGWKKKDKAEMPRKETGCSSVSKEVGRTKKTV